MFKTNVCCKYERNLDDVFGTYTEGKKRKSSFLRGSHIYVR